MAPARRQPHTIDARSVRQPPSHEAKRDSSYRDLHVRCTRAHHVQTPWAGATANRIAAQVGCGLLRSRWRRLTLRLPRHSTRRTSKRSSARSRWRGFTHERTLASRSAPAMAAAPTHLTPSSTSCAQQVFGRQGEAQLTGKCSRHLEREEDVRLCSDHGTPLACSRPLVPCRLAPWAGAVHTRDASAAD